MFRDLIVFVFLLGVFSTPALLAEEKVDKKFNLIMLRGLIREKRHWGDFIPQVRKSMPYANILFLDIPGAGEYNEVDTPQSIPKIVDFMRKDYIKRVTETNKLPTHLLAISLGAMIGSNWLQRYPDDFEKALLINTSFKGFCSLDERFKLKNVGTFVQIPFVSDYRKEKLIVQVISNKKDNYDKVAKEWAKIRKDAPVSFINTVRQLYAASRFKPKKEKPSTPIKLLASLGDRLVDPVCSEAIHKKWKVPIAYHPTAGHDMALDAPDWMIKHMKEWFAGQ